MAEVMYNYLTRSEETRLIKTVREVADLYAQRDLWWIVLSITTGIRVGSLTQLTVADAIAALEGKHLHLRGQITKGGVEHDVFTVDRARKALRQLLKIRRELGLPPDPDGFLLVNRKTCVYRGKRPVSVRSLQQAFRRWAHRCGLDRRITVHGLRHTRGRRIMDESTATDPVGIVQAVLGHKNRATTAIYTKPTKEQVENALRECE